MASEEGLDPLLNTPSLHLFPGALGSSTAKRAYTPSPVLHYPRKVPPSQTPRRGAGTMDSHIPNPISPPPKPLLFSVPSSPTTTALSQVSPSLTWTTSSTRVTGVVHPAPTQASLTQSHQLITVCLMLSSSTSMYLPTYLTSIYQSLSIYLSLYLPIIYLLIQLSESQLMTLHLNPALLQLLRARTVSFHDHTQEIQRGYDPAL